MSNGDSLIRVHVGHQLPDGLPSPEVYLAPGYGRAACISEGGQWALLEAFDGDRELEYRVSGVVIDEDVYQDQVENRAKECETTPEALLAAPYFPAYRGGTK